MIMPLENLYSALIQQYEELCDKTNECFHENPAIFKQYEIQRLAVNILVNMKKNRHKIPRGAFFCGEKLSWNSADVTIQPQNEIVKEIVASYFKEQTHLDGVGAAKPIFNEISLNGECIG